MTQPTRQEVDDGMRKLQAQKKSTTPATEGMLYRMVDAISKTTAATFVRKDHLAQVLKQQLETDKEVLGIIRGVAKAGKSSLTDHDPSEIGRLVGDIVHELLKTEREMTKRDFGEVVNLMKELTAEAKVEIGERDTRIADLEKRLADLEAAPVTYRGVAEVGKFYPANSIVTAKGGMWIAKEGTTTVPEFGNMSWVLAVKAGPPGRDGKDLR